MQLVLKVVYVSNNLAACVAQFYHSDNSPFQYTETTINQIGNFQYDEDGFASVRLDAGERQIFDRSAPCGQVRMLKGNGDFDEVRRCNPRVISIKQ